MSILAKYFEGDLLEIKEAKKLIKIAERSKLIKREDTVLAILGCISMGFPNMILCTDTDIVYWGQVGALKVNTSKYPYRSITSVSSRMLGGCTQLLLGVNGTQGEPLIIASNQENMDRMVDFLRRKTIGTEISETVSFQGAADEIKKFFELKEKGVITEQEYETKKKQLLGL